MKLNHFPTSHAKINSKWMEDLDVRQEPIEILEENIGSNLFDISHSNFFQDTKAGGTKAKMNFWDFIKIKSFCTTKETVNKTKRQPMEWEMILANGMSDKELVSKIYKELIKLNNPKINSKWLKDLDVRQETIKILEENTDSNLLAFGHSNFLLDTSPKARGKKAKMNYWDFIKIKSFCTAKETVNKTKMQPME